MIRASFEVGTYCDVGKVERLYQVLNAEKVFVTWRPTVEAKHFLDTCYKLAYSGMQVVPHLVARNLANAHEFRKLLEIFGANSSTQTVFLLAGDAQKARGPFLKTTDLLNAEQLSKYSINSVCFAAYPQGHVLVSTKELETNLTHKIQLAQKQGLGYELITQLVPAIKSVFDWLEQPHLVETDIRLSVAIADQALLERQLRVIYPSANIQASLVNLEPLSSLELACSKLKLINKRLSVHLIPFHNIDNLLQHAKAINTLLK